ncbi:VRR-NUC domain-containing protein [Thalassospira marina]|uniref:Nuclease n=1 Tax=Thalassospira marina TaxID=2048283 RepID=A0A2N3KY81_9PROT|nr:VRR-NUC domain-containing protein [Thalassospira marina]PKR55426.1 nuclease [Thalassospira marina]
MNKGVRRSNPEEIIHRSVVQYLNCVLPAGVIFFHPANGGVRSKAEGGIFKALGVKAGTPDLVFILPGGRTAFAEIKGPNGSLSKTQKMFRDDALALGCAWVEVRSIDDMKDALTEWGILQ